MSAIAFAILFVLIANFVPEGPQDGQLGKHGLKLLLLVIAFLVCFGNSACFVDPYA